MWVSTQLLEMEKNGIMLPVIEAVCKYRRPAKYDDLLTISGQVEEVSRARIKMACEVHRNDELLVSGYTVHACVNLEGRPSRLPELLAGLTP